MIQEAEPVNDATFDGSVSVIMPAYNEARNIAGNLRETVETLSAMDCDFEVILVDDGSSDLTYLQAAKTIAVSPTRLRVIRYDRNLGKGNALMCGFSYARGEYIVFLDADMDLHPRQLPRFFQIMQERSADAVVGSKFHRESRVEYPAVRRMYSTVYYGLVRLLFGLPLKDTQTGIKLFKAELLRRVFAKVLVKRFAFDIEVLANAHRLGYRIVDAPVTLTFSRKFGRVKMHDVIDVLKDTLAIFYRMHILHYYDRQPVDLDPRTYGMPAVEITQTDLVGP